MLTAAFPLLLFSFFVSSSSALSPPAALRQLLSDTSTCHLMPCCYDGISARLVASSKADFKVTFQTGFGVSAAAGYSDSGVLGLSENAAAAFVVGEALGNVALSLNRAPLPCIADGDTGHGSPLAIRRTIFQFAKARMAGVMIEDQVSPKRCGHVDGKEVVDREEAVRRVKIACDARDDYEKLYGAPGPLILARTDARGVSGGTLEEAIERCLAFREAGADITFLEAPQSVGEMSEYCSRVKGPKLYNALEVSEEKKKRGEREREREREREGELCKRLEISCLSHFSQ